MVAVAFAAAWLGSSPAGTISGPFTVMDGDSLRAGERRLRLEGIDAPEYTQTCTRDGRQWACGRESARFLRMLAGRSRIDCEATGIDRYARDLVRCRTDGRDLNAEIVRQGWAIAYGDYEGEEAEARRAGRGIWAGDFDRPRDWRATHGSADEQEAAGMMAAWLSRFWKMLGDMLSGMVK